MTEQEVAEKEKKLGGGAEGGEERGEEEEEEVTTEFRTLNKTVIFDLKEPTETKKERMDAAMEEISEIVQETSRRIPSVPKTYWGQSTPKHSVWYAWAKEFPSFLSNKDVHENILRVREAYQSWKEKGYEGEKPNFRERGAMSFYYEKPEYITDGDSYYVRLPFVTTAPHRDKEPPFNVDCIYTTLPLRDGDYLREFVDRLLDETDGLSQGRAELIRTDNGEYKLHQVVQDEIPVETDVKTHVGVRMGLSALATTGAIDAETGEKVGAEIWGGREVSHRRDELYRRRKSLQESEKINEIRDLEHRYVENVCHNISREVVEWAKEYENPQIVVPDLTNIGEAFRKYEEEHTADMRRALHSWAFKKMQDMIEYKALEEGIPFKRVAPIYTSQECNECSSRDTERRRADFECKECGYRVNAYVNGAFNIARSKAQE